MAPTINKIEPLGQLLAKHGVVRQAYESEADKSNEEQFRRDIEKITQTRLVALPEFSSADYIICRAPRDGLGGEGAVKDQGTAFAELKCRNIRAEDYGSLMISYKKIEKCLLVGRYIGLQTSVWWRCRDGDFFYTFNKKQAHLIKTVVKGGRTRTTRDAGDIEPCLYVPLELCKKLGDIKVKPSGSTQKIGGRT